MVASSSFAYYVLSHLSKGMLWTDDVLFGEQPTVRKTAISLPGRALYDAARDRSRSPLAFLNFNYRPTCSPKTSFAPSRIMQILLRHLQSPWCIERECLDTQRSPSASETERERSQMNKFLSSSPSLYKGLVFCAIQWYTPRRMERSVGSP